jgi:TonB-linked SusC/RagA family outer membrane protein
MIRKLRLPLAAALLLSPLGLAAQSTVIAGMVRNQSQEPVRGAAVSVEGTAVGTVTNDQGFYRLQLPDGTAGPVTLRVETIGYRPASVSIELTGATVTQDIILVEQAIALDKIIVTGTAGRQSRRAQSAVVSTIDAADVTGVAPVTSVQELLQSRLPGVSVQGAGGNVGGTQVIRMRGQASLELSNEPLIFVDGVRVDQRNSAMIYGVGGQETSRLNDIRPEDIESIEVVKGPAAAALYGADASAGVIQIITKRGRENSGFTQSISTEYHVLDWGYWEPPDNWAACSASAVANEDNPLCYQQAEGTLVSDNPLERTDAVQQGSRRSVTWSGQGGGQNHSYYLSLGGDREEGAFPSNYGENISGRGNFQFQPTPNLRIDMGMGVIRARNRFPQNDNNIYGYLGGALLGSPNSLGTSRDGWYAPNRQVEAINNIQNYNTNIRATPRISVNYSPISWLTNRVTFGADLSRVEARYFYPKNDNGWYSGVLNTGQIGQGREHYDRLTFDYLGNIANQLSASISSDLSLGTQIIKTRRDLTTATGIGLTTNSANAINQAAQTTGGQTFSENIQVGFFGQWQVGYQDRLYAQFAARLDQHSSFGTDAEPFLSPKFGVSWVLSDEPFWQDNMPAFVSALRLRAAYGTTGRSPTSGAIATYDSSPYALTNGSVGSGVTADDLGNADLKPERGTEIEAGFEAGLFDERVGVEFTFFNKKGTDVILERPLPPSAGFSDDQLVNIGEVLNRGFEVAANARLVSTANFGWDARLGFNTLESEVVDLGGIEPYASGWAQEVREGYEANAYFTRQVQEFVTSDSHPQASVCDRDTSGALIPCAIVTEDPEFMGNYLPTFEGNLSSTFTVLRNLRLYALLDWKQNFMIYNNTDQFRERQFGQGERWVRRNDPDFNLSEEERLRRFGPFFTADGDAISVGSVDDAYIEPGDFTRLREVSVHYAIPQSFAALMRASGATLSVGGRNLALWTDYSGPDPEVGLYLDNDRREDFLTLPPERSYFVKLNLQF